MTSQQVCIPVFKSLQDSYTGIILPLRKPCIQQQMQIGFFHFLVWKS